MLLPVLVVGLQDLVIKLLGSCEDFKMEAVSVQREDPPKKRDGRLQRDAGDGLPLPFGTPADQATVTPCPTPLMSPSTPCTSAPHGSRGATWTLGGIWGFIRGNGKGLNGHKGRR